MEWNLGCHLFHLKPSEMGIQEGLSVTEVKRSRGREPDSLLGKLKLHMTSCRRIHGNRPALLEALGQELCGVSLGQGVGSSWDPFKGARANPGFLG